MCAQNIKLFHVRHTSVKFCFLSPLVGATKEKFNQNTIIAKGSAASHESAQ